MSFFSNNSEISLQGTHMCYHITNQSNLHVEEAVMEASCSCNCTCLGSWITPMVSVPVHNITFEGNNRMMCAQSSIPRHQLGCNLPSIGRRYTRSVVNLPTESSQIMLLLFFLFIYTLIIVVCTLMIIKRIRRP